MKIKMKRSLSLLLTVCFLLGALPLTMALDDAEPGDIVCTDEAADAEVVAPVVEEDDGEDEIIEEKEEAAQDGCGYAESEELPDELDDAESEELSDESDDINPENDTGTETSNMDNNADAADLSMITMFTDETVELVNAVATLSTAQINLSSNPADTSGAGWSWVQSTRTLTLNGLNLDVTGVDAIIMPTGVASTIVLIGTNTIISKSVGCRGIVANGNLNITGGGTLSIIASWDGIVAWTGDVTITGGTFDIAGTVGIGTWGGNVTIDGGTFKITAEENGIRSSGNTTISNAKITLDTGFHSIHTQLPTNDAAIKINDSEIVITSKQSGIFATGDVTITGGAFNINTEGAVSASNADGIYCSGNVTIGNAKITLVTRGNGIVASSNIEVSATEIKINSRNSGISSGGNVTITGGTFEIESVENGIVGINVTIRGSGTINVAHVDSEKFVVRATGTLKHPEMLVFGWDGTCYTVASSTAELVMGYTFVDAATNAQLANIKFVPITSTITFDGNGGTSSEAMRTVGHGLAIGTLPTASQSGYSFNGWFTHASGGTQISASTIITGDVTFFAQWTQYSFSGGSDTFVQGSEQPLVLTIQKDFALFSDVLVNDNLLIRDTHYTAQSGSTIITLLPAYLDTLSPGQHTIEIRFTDGVSVIIHFTTETAQENTTNESETETGNNNNSTGLPQTGVISNIVLFASLLLISIAGAIFTLILMKRNKEQSRG